MLNFFTSYLVYLIELSISYILLSKISEKKLTSFKCLLIGALLFCAGTVINVVFKNSIWVNGISSIIIYIVFEFLCFEINMAKSIFYSVILTVLSGTLEFLTIFGASAILDVPTDAYNSNGALMVIEVVTCKLLFFIACLILARLIKKDKSKAKFPFSFFIFPAVVLLSLIAYWYICIQETIANSIQIILSCISALLFLSTIILFITYQNNVEKENRYLMIHNELRRLQMEKNYYDILQHQNQGLRLYAHDAKNHLSVIKALNSNPEIEKYIDEMTDNLNEYTKSCHTGNITLDVIISRYKTECAMKNVSFSFDITLSNLSYVESFDLVTILGNLLDNALEAAEKSTDKFITFAINKHNSCEALIITNSCDEPPVSDHNRLLTTKKDKKVHGLGLKSVISKIKKYDGDIDWKYIESEKKFVVTVLLNAKKNNANQETSVQDKDDNRVKQLTV